MGGCPGQNSQFWGHDAIFEVSCTNCGNSVEFFKDDAQRKCSKCGTTLFNPKMDFSCAKWCPSAKSCLGEEKYNNLMQSNKDEEEREKEIETLISTVAEEDADVRDLFKKLYLKNKDGSVLFDVKELYLLQTDNPKLFKKATQYFSKFTRANIKE